jgi:hypothetical protein
MLIHNALITGSLLVNGTGYNTGSFSGSFIGAVAGTTATASYVEYNSVANKPALVSGSSQIIYSGLTGIPSGIVSGSSQVEYSGLTGIPSGIVSGSAQISEFGIFATTGSNGFNGSQAITGSLTVTGQVVAQTLNVQQVTSSIVYSSGSNIFGNSLANTQQFTGSVGVTGSLTIGGNVGIGTSSPNQLLHLYTNIETSSGVGTALQITSDGAGGDNAWIGVNKGAGNGLEFSVENRDIIFNTGATTPFGGTERLRIASTGAATFSSSVTATKGFFSSNAASDSTTALLANASTNDSSTYAALFGSLNAGYRMVVRADGNVGIGVNSPAVLLNIERSVSGTSLGDGMLFKMKNTSTTTNTRSGINFGNIDGIGGSLAMQSAILKNAATGEYDMTWDLYGGAAGWQEGILYIDSNPGRIGINTSSPGTKLEVLSRAADADRTLPHNILTLTAEQGNAPYGPFGGAILFKNRSYVSGLVESSRIRSVIYDDGAPSNFGGGLWFETTPTPGGSLTPSLVINYQGRVGIGTTSPDAIFHVARANSGGVGGQVVIDNPASSALGNTVEISFLTDAGASGAGTRNARILAVNENAGNGAANMQFHTWDGSSSAERMRITSGGTLAIGTTDIPTLSTPSGGQLTVMPNAVIVSGIIALGSPYTQNIQIDVVYNNWGGNNVIGLVDMIITLREYANTSGTAFGKIFATNSSGGATFASFNTTDVTTSQCSVTAVSGGNYTLRITIDPSNVTDRGSFYLIIPNAGGTGSSISSITVSYV